MEGLRSRAREGYVVVIVSPSTLMAHIIANTFQSITTISSQDGGTPISRGKRC